jgi:hypothetical protein
LTVTDNTGGENTITLTVDVPRVNANVVFVQSGPVSLGFSVLSGVSALDTKTQNYRGPSWLAWSRTTDLSAIDEQLRINVRKSLIPVALPPGYTQEQVKKYGYPREPYSLKFATEDAEQNYDVDFFAPADSNAPYGFNEFFGAEIPPPAVETPNPPDVAIGGGLYSVRFDNQTYFKVFIDTSGSMRAYENSYRTAANNVQAEMASVFFNNDAALARKYILPYTNIGNERWGDWAMSTLYESGEPAKQVIIAAINEDSSGGQGTPNSAILAKAQAMFDSGGHYYFILIAPPGGNSGGMFSNGPALASTRVTKGGEQIRWCQWSRETASGGALTDVIKQILGFNAIL